jgi:hypothetical protein
MRVTKTLAVVGAVAALLLLPALCTAADGPGDAIAEDQVLESTCSITVLCNCVDEEISCSGPTGTCYSGGSSCDEWVQCGTGGRTYCPTVPPCGGAPTCTTNKECNSYCYPDIGICVGSGCCAC